MTVFWVVAVCLVIAALMFVLPPLLRPRETQGEAITHDVLNVSVYRNQLAELKQDLVNGTVTQDQYDKAVSELERRLLQDVKPGETLDTQPKGEALGKPTAMIMLVAIPLAAVLLYTKLGEPGAVTGEVSPEQLAAQVEHPETGQGAQVQQMVEQLASRLKTQPDDYQGWFMLARSYEFLQQPEKRAEALENLRKRLSLYMEENPDDITAMLYMATAYRMERRHEEAATYYRSALPYMQANPQEFGENLPDLLGDVADTLALANGGRLAGEPMEVIQWALEVNPQHIQSLWLAGTFYYEQQNFAEALGYWQRIKAAVPPGSEQAQAMEGNIAEAKQRLRDLGQPIPEDAVPAVAAASGGGSVSGRVTLDPALQGQVSPSDTVFIFARAAQGPRMPLAIMRTTVAELPVEFSLNDSMAMMPDMALSNFGDVVVGARVSKTGDAMPQSGDLQGLTPVVQVGRSDLQIKIDSVVQ